MGQLEELGCQVGDVVECVGDINGCFTVGKEYSVIKDAANYLAVLDGDGDGVRPSESTFRVHTKGRCLGDLPIVLGDKIKCVYSSGTAFPVGEVYEVVMGSGRLGVRAEDDVFWQETASRFIIIEKATNETAIKDALYPNPPHIHQKEIIAWANGADIEYLTPVYNNWCVTPTPPWNSGYKYRVANPRRAEIKAEIERLEEKLKSLD